MKLIASDYDGTIKYDAEGLKKDIEAIKEWKKAGNIFAIISGRNAPQIRDIVINNAIPADLTLGDSGNSCYRTDKLEYAFPANGDILKKLYDLLLVKKTYYIVVNLPEKATIVYRKKDGCIVCDLYGSIDEFNRFTQVSAIFESVEDCFSAASAIKEEFGNSLTALPNGECLDIVPGERTKAYCVGYLAEYLGIAPEDIYTVGDNYNDIAMLDAYNSFAVSNAPDGVKSHAKLGITNSVADMIYRLLNK